MTKKFFPHVEPALVYDNFIRITTYTGIFRAFQAKINILIDIGQAEDRLILYVNINIIL